MALAPIKNRAFIDKNTFTVVFADNSITRQSFSEVSGLKVNFAEKVWIEGGDPIGWTGVGTVSYDDITLVRGFGLDKPFVDGGVVDKELYLWAEAAINGVDGGVAGAGVGSYKKDFSIIPITRVGDEYGFFFQVLQAVPRSYEAPSFDGTSDDTATETLVCKPSRWYLDDGTGTP